MASSSQTIRKIELKGAIFIIILGAFLNFAYELSGNNLLVGLFSAVNESVWEHLKLSFVPGFLWLFIQKYFYRLSEPNLYVARAVALFVALVLIVLLFYGYLIFLEKPFLPLDILIFFVSVLTAQHISYKILSSEKDYSAFKLIAISAILIMLGAFVIFTFDASDLSIFRELE